MGAVASSVRWWSRRRRRTGARLQWMAGSQHACSSGQQMRCVCNSMQQSGVGATTCSGSGGGGGAKSSGRQLLLAKVWNFHTGIVCKVILGSLQKIFYILPKCIVHTI
jgi:hypothetical protein